MMLMYLNIMIVNANKFPFPDIDNIFLKMVKKYTFKEQFDLNIIN